MEQRDPVACTDEIQRVETALNALSAKKAANDAMRKASTICRQAPPTASYRIDGMRPGSRRSSSP